LHNAAINIAKEFGNPRVNLLKKDIALNLSILDNTIFKFKAPSNIIVNANKELNNTMTNIAIDLHNIIACKLRDMGNILNAPSELIVVDILGIVKPDLTTLEYNIMDLNILRAKSRA
jgi:hypothetical protein